MKNIIIDIYLRSDSNYSLTKTYRINNEERCSLILISTNFYKHRIYIHESRIIVYSIKDGKLHGYWKTRIST